MLQLRLEATSEEKGTSHLPSETIRNTVRRITDLYTGH